MRGLGLPDLSVRLGLGFGLVDRDLERGRGGAGTGSVGQEHAEGGAATVEGLRLDPATLDLREPADDR